MKTPDEKDKIRAEFYTSIDKSESDLERKITYISAGALVLSISFIEKIVDLKSAEYLYQLIMGWIFLSVTLAVNLISTLISRKLTMKSLKDFDADMEEHQLTNNIAKRNSLISNLDLSSLISLFVGIFFIVLFCSVNLGEYRKNSIDMSKSEIIEKGRVIQTPRPNTSTSTSGNGTGNNSGNGSGNSSAGNSSSNKK